jgi:hypothetical protein
MALQWIHVYFFEVLGSTVLAWKCPLISSLESAFGFSYIHVAALPSKRTKLLCLQCSRHVQKSCRLCKFKSFHTDTLVMALQWIHVYFFEVLGSTVLAWKCSLISSLGSAFDLATSMLLHCHLKEQHPCVCNAQDMCEKVVACANSSLFIQIPWQWHCNGYLCTFFEVLRSTVLAWKCLLISSLESAFGFSYVHVADFV